MHDTIYISKSRYTFFHYISLYQTMEFLQKIEIFMKIHWCPQYINPLFFAGININLCVFRF